MKFMFTLFISAIVLVSCKNEKKSLSEDFNAICFVSNGEEIELGNGVYMNPPIIHYVLFSYHDTVFQVAIKDRKSTYSYLKCNKTAKDSLSSLFSIYRKTSLKKQLENFKTNGKRNSCAPSGYFLFRENDNYNFGIFDYMDYYEWIRRFGYKKEIKLTSNQFPKIYQTVYHSLNSKQWDYVMSDDYYYKDIRTANRHIEFITDTTAN